MENQELIQKAIETICSKTIVNAEMGGVACALLTDQGNVYTGVCIDTICSMGFCAEHNAIGTMITNQEYRIQKIVAVKYDSNGNPIVIPPCGRCREFIYQINPENINTEVIMGECESVLLGELLPCLQ
jgi:cytidine deaminase